MIGFNQIKKNTIGIVCLVLIGCVGLPVDTLNKRLAVFELGYIQTLQTMKLWIDEGRIADDEKVAMQARVKDMADARKALYIAKDLGDLSTIEGQLSVANGSLKLLRDYISNKEKIP